MMKETKSKSIFFSDRVVFYDRIRLYNEYGALAFWIFYITFMTGAAAIFCHLFSRQAIGI